MRKVLIGVLVLVAIGAAAAWYWPRAHGPGAVRLPEEIAEAKGAMDAAKARLAKANAGFRDEQKRQAKADYESAQADLAKAESEYARIKGLTPPAVSPMEVDNAKAARESARGRMN